MPAPYIRKTKDVWKIFVWYPGGWEWECTEMSRADMKVNVKAYRDAGYSVRVRTGRERIEVKDAQDSNL